MKRKEREMKLENKNLVQVNFYYLEADLHATKKTELGIFVLFFEYRVNISYFCAFRIFLRKLYIFVRKRKTMIRTLWRF